MQKIGIALNLDTNGLQSGARQAATALDEMTSALNAVQHAGEGLSEIEVPSGDEVIRRVAGGEQSNRTVNPPRPATERTVNPPIQTQERVVNPPIQTQERIVNPPSPTQERIANPPNSTQERTVNPPSPTQERIANPPNSTQERTVNPPSPTQERVVNPPSPTQERTVNPPNPTQERVVNPPNSTQEERIVNPKPARRRKVSPPNPARSRTANPPNPTRNRKVKPPSQTQERTVNPKPARRRKISPPNPARGRTASQFNTALKEMTHSLSNAAKVVTRVVKQIQDIPPPKQPPLPSPSNNNPNPNHPPRPQQAQHTQEQGLKQLFSVEKLSNTLTQSVDMFVSSLNRANIVSLQGAGDWRGAQIAEKRRTAGIVSGVGSLAGGALGGVLFGPAGALVGSSLGTLAGKPFEAQANKLETQEAYSQNWEQHSEQALKTNALLNDTSGSYQKNTHDILNTFLKSGEVANKWGYSTAEGMQVMQEAARQGLGTRSAPVADTVFHYERSTGADRQKLLQAATRSARFGGGDILANAYAGTAASGMEKGQFQEFLTGLERIFEEGIEKGFTKGTAEITRDLVFLSELSGGNSMWSGEQGAKKLSQMNSGVQQATSLATVADIQAFRAARSLVTGEEGEQNYNKITGEVTPYAGDYIDTMKVLERGLSPDLFKEQMKLIEESSGGDHAEGVEQIRKSYGLNYTASDELYNFYQKSKKEGLSDKAIEEKITSLTKDPGNYESMDKQLLEIQKRIETAMAELGQSFSEAKLGDLKTELGGTGGINGSLKDLGITTESIYKILQKQNPEAVNEINNKVLSDATKVSADPNAGLLARYESLKTIHATRDNYETEVQFNANTSSSRERLLSPGELEFFEPTAKKGLTLIGDDGKLDSIGDPARNGRDSIKYNGQTIDNPDSAIHDSFDEKFNLIAKEKGITPGELYDRALQLQVSNKDSTTYNPLQKFLDEYQKAISTNSGDGKQTISSKEYGELAAALKSLTTALTTAIIEVSQ